MEVNEDFLKDIGNRLRDARQRKRYSQGDVADKMGVGTSQYGKLERGLVSPSLKTLVGVAKVLNISLDEIVFGEQQIEKNTSNSPFSQQIERLENLPPDEKYLATEFLNLVFTRDSIQSIARGYKSVPKEFLKR